MLRPSPVPVPNCLVEKNGSKILSRMAGGMPAPAIDDLDGDVVARDEIVHLGVGMHRA
jgi:hypothetical protein